VSIEKQGSNDVILHLNRIDPVTMMEEGRQKRFVIVFKPLGINQFMSEPPGELLQTNNPTLVPVSIYFKELTEFCNGDKMELSLPGAALIIEELLLKRFKPFSNLFLEQAIAEMDSTDQLSKIENLALHVGTSAKTLNRLFRKYIGLSPVEFRKILQFRKALRNRLSDEKATFRDIAWDNSYHDLPYMIKVFKEFTGRSMKNFFNELSYSMDKQYLYIG
jgi:AraC-like DNA-binding protein